MEQTNPDLLEATIFRLLVDNYPALYSRIEIVSQISRDPDDELEAVPVEDALQQLRADQLIRKHGHCWSATLAAVRASALTA
ncbi:MAG: hypothetical protein ACRDKI_03880 [Solirubrobacterales bacterium]